VGPTRIWLQPLTEDHRDGWTWCWHEIGEADAPDIAYVRADVVDDLVEALRKIADEESGWRFKRDPLEHARSVVEEMREVARAALSRMEGTGNA
jgi:hypothetical protein